MGRTWRIVIPTVVLILAGLVFLRGPTPHISLKPETLFSFGIVNVTNTIITSWIVVALIIVGVFLMTRRWELVPRGAQNVLEAILETFYNVVTGIAGEKNGRRFFPAVATIFFFVLIGNWLSLTPIFNVIGLGQEEEHGFVMKRVDVGPLPITYTTFSRPGHWKGDTIDKEDPQAAQKAEQEKEKGNFVGELKPFLRSINTDLNTPLALAIMSGFRGLRHLNFGEVFGGIIDAFVGMLEFISETVRLVSFTFRLFGNMFAGEVVILMFTFLFPLILTLPFYALEIVVGIMQAFIFATLTLVFGMMAVSHGGPHPEEAEATGHAPETALT
jgi:F-type H+-transporting ATPase subunit a